MRFTAQQIASFASGAGFSGNDLVTAVAIALAESGGDPQQYNPEIKARGGTPPGYGSYGLWQIYRKMHPEFASWNLYDPNQNAAAAYSVYQAQGFAAWSTYTNGAYLKYLPMVSQALATA